MEFLNSIDSKFLSCGTSAIASDECIISGRPFGGVGILWRKDLNVKVTVKKFDDPRFMAVDVHSRDGSDSFCIVNVYMPYQSPDNRDEYVFCLGLLESFAEEISSNKIAFFGDFNAKPGSEFWTLLQNFCGNLSLTISDRELLSVDSYTVEPP